MDDDSFRSDGRRVEKRQDRLVERPSIDDAEILDRRVRHAILTERRRVGVEEVVVLAQLCPVEQTADPFDVSVLHISHPVVDRTVGWRSPWVIRTTGTEDDPFVLGRRSEIVHHA